MSCACSAGPAFEGGDISCGMRATDGAVEAVRLEKGDAGAKAAHRRPGRAAAGAASPAAVLSMSSPSCYRTSAIDPKGNFVREGRPHRSGYPPGWGAISWPLPKNRRRGGRSPSQRWTLPRSFRAKGAIYSAIDAMLSRAGFHAGDDRPGLCRGRHRQRDQYGKRRAHRHVPGCTPGEIPVYRQFLPGRGLCHGALSGRSGQGRRDRFQYDVYGAFDPPGLYG